MMGVCFEYYTLRCFLRVSTSLVHDDSCDCCASEERREGGGGVVRRDGGGGEVETYSSIQLIKIPLSKKPVKFR